MLCAETNSSVSFVQSPPLPLSKGPCLLRLCAPTLLPTTALSNAAPGALRKHI
jgi:hypothetical protein